MGDLNNWQENLVKHLDKNNDKIVDALGYLKKGTKYRDWLDKKLPGFADSAEEAISEMAKKQSGKRNASSKKARSPYEKSENVPNRARYRILPLN